MTTMHQQQKQRHHPTMPISVTVHECKDDERIDDDSRIVIDLTTTMKDKRPGRKKCILKDQWWFPSEYNNDNPTTLSKLRTDYINVGCEGLFEMVKSGDKPKTFKIDPNIIQYRYHCKHRIEYGCNFDLRFCYHTKKERFFIPKNNSGKPHHSDCCPYGLRIKENGTENSNDDNQESTKKVKRRKIDSATTSKENANSITMAPQSGLSQPLNTFTIPATMVSIPKDFIDKNVEEIIFHHQVNEIQDSACYMHSTLKSIKFQRGIDDNSTNGLSKIGDFAFSFCCSLRTIQNIPQSLSKLGARSFSQCISLQQINIENTNIKIIPEICFMNCIELKVVWLPKGLQEIQCLAFFNCKTLPNIEFPSSLMNIGSQAFTSCKSLQSLNLQHTQVNVISCYCFAGCLNLTSVKWPGALTTIEKEGFRRCVSLHDIEESFPPTLKTIEENAFQCCQLLEYPDNISSLDIHIHPSNFSSRFDGEEDIDEGAEDLFHFLAMQR